MTAPLLETHDLVKDYVIGGEVLHAVNGVSLSIKRGEFVAIMGASGSGKSTFMNMIGCLDVPTSGTLLLDGIDTKTLNSDALAEIRNRKIGFVFQQFNLLARTSALDNVAVPLIYAGLGYTERRERAQAKLEAMGLGNRLQNTPAKLTARCHCPCVGHRSAHAACRRTNRRAGYPDIARYHGYFSEAK
jgi:putative ABC transport system ATP-binding protein